MGKLVRSRLKLLDNDFKELGLVKERVEPWEDGMRTQRLQG